MSESGSEQKHHAAASPASSHEGIVVAEVGFVSPDAGGTDASGGGAVGGGRQGCVGACVACEAAEHHPHGQV